MVRQEVLDREYVVLEKLQGEMIQSFMDQPAEVLQDLGEGLARIHSTRFDYVGNSLGDFRIESSDFHNHLILTMNDLITKFYWDDEAIKRVYLEIGKKIEGVMSILDLSQCRRAYRFLYRLLSVQGNVDIDKWMGQKILSD